MNLIDNIASIFGYSKRISGIQTMIFTGNEKTQGFRIDLTSFSGLQLFEMSKIQFLEYILSKKFQLLIRRRNFLSFLAIKQFHCTKLLIGDT